MKIQPGQPRSPHPPTPPPSPRQLSPDLSALQVRGNGNQPTMTSDNGFRPVDLSRPRISIGAPSAQSGRASASVPQLSAQTPICVFMTPGNYNITYRALGGTTNGPSNGRYYHASNPDRSFGMQRDGGKGGDRYFKK